MTTEEKKQFLRAYRTHERNIKRIQDEIDEVRELQQSVSAMQSDGMPHAHNVSDLSDYMVKLEKHITFLNREKKAKVEAYKRIVPCIEAMEDETEKDVLFFRYIKGYRWEKIADVMMYSMRQVHNIHGRALNNFEVKDCTNCTL